jgi:hypothetical protein
MLDFTKANAENAEAVKVLPPQEREDPGLNPARV